MAEIKYGDYVRITIEGPWLDDGYGTTEEIKAIGLWGEVAGDTVMVEKIDPPVEVFKPGDRLRRKGFGDYEITLGDKGYLQHHVTSTGRVRYHKYSDSTNPEWFTSQRFEKVDIG